MKLQSISKPQDGGAEAAQGPLPEIREVLTGAAERAAPLPDNVRRRLVTGKSDSPIFRRPDVAVETVIDADERTRIVSTELYPWKLVCALKIDGPNGVFIGTGWFAGPRTLITAGHCVYDDRQMGGWAREIAVTPGRERERAPFGEFKATRFSSVDAWVSRQDPDFDIAAIHLEQNIFDPSDVFRVGAFPDAELQGYLLNVSGYPASPGGGAELWFAKNRIRAVTPRRIFYDVDTSGGQSGGPAFILPDENAQPIVVGIHAYGEGGTPASIGLRVNSAPRIIPEVVEQIQQWIEADLAGA